eukprot:TRINITY_DN9799_c0_g1_i2.p1 TRINITY_DN9799_c0_g1~~TRINITY_DN9799_c0_g1_i2.p1  ORF type:complete len:408 (-),score=127.34 TRINITY_DN9799_c0_g1_i2:1099-2292(-)
MIFYSFLLCLLVLCASSSASVLSMSQYSMLLSTNLIGTTSAGNVTVSMKPDPITGDLQPRIVVDMRVSDGPVYLGSSRSAYGGMLRLSESGYSTRFSTADTTMDMLDLTSQGWLSSRDMWVNKTSQGTTTYSMQLRRYGRWGFYISSNAVHTASSSDYKMVLEVDQNQTPLFFNVTDTSTSTDRVVYSHKVLVFRKRASTLQKDAHLYVASDEFFSSTTPRDPPAVETRSFYRSYTNDSYARYLENDNVADNVGEAYWVCGSQHTNLLFAEFIFEIDTNFGNYALCNKGTCSCGSYIDRCQTMGSQQSSGDGHWYSLPIGGRCAAGFPIGTNNCTWSGDYVLNAVVESACLNTINDTVNYTPPAKFSPTSCSNLDKAAGHLEYALKNCPDVKGSLPW